MTAESDLFPAKILLTGEFTVIDGGIALAFRAKVCMVSGIINRDRLIIDSFHLPEY